MDSATHHNDIVLAFKQGDNQAYSLIFHLQYASVYLLAKKLTKEDVIAKDLAHDVFLKLYEHRSNLSADNMASLRSWLLVTTRNMAFDHLTRRQQEQKSIEEFHAIMRLPQEAFYQRLEIQQRVLEAIHRRVLQLPELEQKIFRLSFIEQRSNEQVSELLNIAQKTVANRKSQIIAKLRMSKLSFGMQVAVIGSVTMFPPFYFLHLN